MWWMSAFPVSLAATSLFCVSDRFFSVTGRLRRVYGVILTALLFLLSGCQDSKPPLKVGTNVWPGYESLYLARDMGFLDAKQISLVEKVNATQVLRDFKSGQLDVAALTMDEALTLLASGESLRVINIMDFSRGADVLVVKPDIQQPEDLKGRTVVAEKTAVGAILLQSALEHLLISSDAIKVINAPVNEHLRQWQKPETAAVVTFEPVTSRLLQSGGRVLFGSHQIPNRIMDVLVVSEEVALSRGEALSALLNAHYRALDMMQQQPDVAAPILARRLDLPADQVWTSFDGLYIPDLKENRRLLSGNSELMMHITDLERLMRDSDLLRADVPLSPRLLDGRFLPPVGGQ